MKAILVQVFNFLFHWIVFLKSEKNIHFCNNVKYFYVVFSLGIFWKYAKILYMQENYTISNNFLRME